MILSQRDHYTLSVDDDILQTDFHGVWTRQEADEYLGDLQAIDARMRRKTGRVNALVTVRMVQAPAVALYFYTRARPIVRPEDRCAVVFATILSKFQIKRLITLKNIALFTNREEALAWLRA